METIGIMGTGRMGVRLALLLAEAGNQVTLGSRDTDVRSFCASRFPKRANTRGWPLAYRPCRWDQRSNLN
jgi:predicted dinucleotide-binding enzyme